MLVVAVSSALQLGDDGLSLVTLGAVELLVAQSNIIRMVGDGGSQSDGSA